VIDRNDPWRIWLDLHGPALLLYARQFSAARSDAEDAMQDGFIKFWKTRDRAQDDTAYLFTCVRSAAIDLSRSSHRRDKHLVSTPPQPTPLFESSLERDEQRHVIESALIKLPADQREILVLKIWGSLTFAQIAETTGLNANTAASRYRYALQHLEQHLSPEVARD
jgi:RNA polymerase sigma-70 factor (ECF subfamily)